MLNKFRLKIAIQKSGRLHEESYELLKKCGIKIHLQNRLLEFSKNMPIDIMQVRDDDIPELIINGMADLGIVGENVLEENLLSKKFKGENPLYKILRRLDFGDCRLSIAVLEDEKWFGIHTLENKRIATSYPYMLKNYLDKFNIKFNLCLLNGSVEVAPKAGLADAIFDLVSTGTTLESNRLKEVEIIYKSKACLIQSNNNLDEIKQELIKKLMIRIQGIIQAKESKYIIMHAPKNRINEIINLLPGVEQPTTLPLVGNKNQVALHMVSSETLFWETMERLKILGAKSILVLPIEKMME